MLASVGMKQYSHVYVALKSVELVYDGLARLETLGGKRASSKIRGRYREEASRLQHLLDIHRGFTLEAAWAPDMVLTDMHNHTFKLYRDDDFPGVGLGQEPPAEATVRDGKTVYYRESGAAPYRIDHLARFINNSMRLKAYSDCFSHEQVLYLMLLLSHYIVDVNVPFHCDARDLKFKAGMPGDKRFYYKTTKVHGQQAHAWVEEQWERACLDLGHGTLFKAMRGEYEDEAGKSTLSDYVALEADAKGIKPVLVTRSNLLRYLTRMCIRSKQLSHAFVNPQDQRERALSSSELSDCLDAALVEHTRTVFERSVSAVISIWMFCWLYPETNKDAAGD